MERGPLPPHERSWRHPSEVAADARRAIRTERPTRPVRAAALAGGAATMVLVGVAVLALTPETRPTPTVASSTPVQRVAAVSITVPGPPALRPRAIANGLGSDGMAVLPSHAVRTVLGPSHPDHHGSGTALIVTMHDGSVARARVVDPGDGIGLAVVQLDGETSAGFEVAPTTPAGDDVVTVLADEPVTIVLHRLADDPELAGDVAAGTAVVDTEGRLVGVMTGTGADGPAVVIVTATRTGVVEVPLDVSVGDGDGPTVPG